MVHEQLCERARRWLRGTRRCDPVYSRNASCAEIPDAIGWSSCYRWCGSTVIECKASLSDFYADKSKKLVWRHPRWDEYKVGGYRGRRMGEKEALAQGYYPIEIPMMGDYRFYFCLEGLILAHQVEKHAPDHGLLWLNGRSVRVIREAPRRTEVDKDAEIRYLRFAIINKKRGFELPKGETDGTLQFQADVRGPDPGRGENTHDSGDSQVSI